MSVFEKVLYFFALPILGVLFYDPATLGEALPVIAVTVAFMVGLGYLLWSGNTGALTLMIFVMGINVIVRLMMVLSTSFNEAGKFNASFTIFGLAGLAISFYLMLRLDKVDVRQHMLRR